MTSFLIRRLALSLLTGFAVLTLVFVLVRIVPGDPAQVILGDQASQSALEAIRVRLGLDKPLDVQYVEFLGHALRGDWGVSMMTGRPVIGEILKVLPWTLELSAVSLILGAAIGVPLGVWSATNRNRTPDYLTRLVSLFGLSVPPFVLAVLLLLAFSIALPLFPVISAESGGVLEWLRSITLPAINLGLIS